MKKHRNISTIELSAPGRQALRRGRESVEGGIYFVTATTVERMRLFEDFNCAVAAARVFECKNTLRTSTVLSWVLMPDHAHWLLEIGDGDSLFGLVKRLKGTSALRCNRATGRQGSIWAAGYMDQAVRKEADVLAVARYIVANPIRARMVNSVSEYPFWNAVWL